MEKYIEVEENFWGAERGAHVSLVSLGLGMCEFVARQSIP